MRWTPLLLAASTATLVQLAPSRGVAASRQAVALIVLPAQASQASQARSLRRKLRKAFAGDDSVKLVDPLRATAPAATKGLDPQIEAAMRHGFMALERGDYRAALEQFSGALKQMQQQLARVPKVRLAEAQLHLAVAQLGSGKPWRARQTLRALATWRVSHPMQPRLGRPSGWQALVGQVKAWAESANTASLEVRSEPPGAEAFVDGFRLGATPARAPSLVRGTHYLTLKLEGYRRVVQRVEVGSKPTHQVMVRLEPVPAQQELVQNLQALGAQLDQSRVQLPALLSDQLGLERALVVQLQGAKRARAVLFRLPDGQRLAQARNLSFGGQLTSDQRKALSLWRAAELAQPKPAQPPTKAPAAGTAWYKRWYFWGFVGLAVAAGVAIPVALTQSDQPKPAERLQITW